MKTYLIRDWKTSVTLKFRASSLLAAYDAANGLMSSPAYVGEIK